MSQRRKLVAIFAADVVGYSRLMADDEQSTIEVLHACRDVIRKHVTAHEGRVVDSPGDALLAEFPSAVEAVLSALQIQQELGRRNAQLAEHRRMHFRIGINLGDVIEEDGALYGDGVNVAARLEGLANPGGICISGTAFDQVDGKLPLSFKAIGEQQVKNIPKPIRAYQALLQAGLPTGSGPRSRLVLMAASALALGGLVVVLAVWQFHRPGSSERAPDPILAMPAGPAIAVLPLTNLDRDPKQEYFADGLSEDIITRLSRFLNLRVLGRNSTFQYKGKSADVRQIGRDLGADYIVEGSVRRDSKRLRVTVQLLDAHTGSHVWAETYDRNLTTSAIFDAQDDITNRVAAAIASTHGAIATARMKELRAKTPAAMASYECVLLGQEYERLITRDSNLAALRCLQRAVEREPNYADGWAWLADMYIEGAQNGFLDSGTGIEASEKAHAAAHRALTLDPDNQWARAVLSKIYMYRKDRMAAIAEAERALALNPNNTHVLADLAYRYLAPGHWERGAALMHKAIALNPNPPGWYYGLDSLNAYRLGRFEDALTYGRKAEIPGFHWSYLYTAAALGQLGRIEEARVEVGKLLALRPDYPKVAREDMDIYLFGNQELVDLLIDGLRKAGMDIPEQSK
jgi:adenylate cyclase